MFIVFVLRQTFTLVDMTSSDICQAVIHSCQAALLYYSTQATEQNTYLPVKLMNKIKRQYVTSDSLLFNLRTTY